MLRALFIVVSMLAATGALHAQQEQIGAFLLEPDDYFTCVASTPAVDGGDLRFYVAVDDYSHETQVWIQGTVLRSLATSGQFDPNGTFYVRFRIDDGSWSEEGQMRYRPAAYLRQDVAEGSLDVLDADERFVLELEGLMGNFEFVVEGLSRVEGRLADLTCSP